MGSPARALFRPKGGLDTRADLTAVSHEQFRTLDNLYMGTKMSGLRPRLGYSRFNTNQDATYVRTLGIFDIQKRDGTQIILRIAEKTGNDEAVIQVWNTGTSDFDNVKTGLTTGEPTVAMIGDWAYICMGNHTDPIYAYDGTAAASVVDGTNIRPLGIWHSAAEGYTANVVVRFDGEVNDYSGESDRATVDAHLPLDGFNEDQVFYLGLPEVGYLGGKSTPQQIDFDMGSNVNAISRTLTAEYSTPEIDSGGATVGIAWKTLPGFSDGTDSGGAPFAIDGAWTFTIPNDWARAVVDDKDRYWIKITVDDDLSVTVDADTIELVYETTHTLKNSTVYRKQDVVVLSGFFSDVNDALILTSSSRLPPPTAFKLNVGSANANPVTIEKICYFDEDSSWTTPENWPEATLLSDGTESGGATLAVDGVIAFSVDDPSAMASNYRAPSYSGYAVAIFVSGVVDTPTTLTAAGRQPIIVEDFTRLIDDRTADDMTTAIQTAGSPYGIADSLAQADGYIYFGFSDLKTFEGIRLAFNTFNSTTGLGAYQYWNAEFWTNVTGLQDGTVSGGVVWGQDGDATWIPNFDWVPTEVNGAVRFWVRFRPATANLDAEVEIDTVHFIETVAPKAKHLAAFQNYLHLADVKIGSDVFQSRVNFSALNNPDKFAIDDFLNYAPLANGEPVTAMSTFGRFAFNFTETHSFLVIFEPDSEVFFKHEHLHKTLGCVGPSAVIETEDTLFYVTHQGPHVYIKGPGETGITSLRPVFVGSPMEGIWEGNEYYTARQKDRNARIRVMHDADKKNIIMLTTASGSSYHDEGYVFDYHNSQIAPSDEGGQAGNYIWSKYTWDQDMEAGSLVKTATGTYTVITGDSNGFVHKHDSSTSDKDENNANAAIPYEFRTGDFDGGDGNEPIHKRFFNIHWTGRQNATGNLTTKEYYDYSTTARTSGTVNLFQTGGVTGPPIRNGIQAGGGKAIALGLALSTVGINFSFDMAEVKLMMKHYR